MGNADERIQQSGENVGKFFAVVDGLDDNAILAAVRAETDQPRIVVGDGISVACKLVELVKVKAFLFQLETEVIRTERIDEDSDLIGH